MARSRNFDFGVEFHQEGTKQENKMMRMSEKEISEYINGQKAKATKYKEVTDLNTFTRFCRGINEQRALETLPAEDLDNILCQFFINAKTLKGKDYEPDTLTSIRNSLQRILTERGSNLNIREDMKFSKSQKVLASRRKHLTKLGKGNKENAARPLTTNEVDYLFQQDFFGQSNPATLQRTVWWMITQHFGHRARDEGRQLKYGDIVVQSEFGSDLKYLEWRTERSTKTRTGERPRMGHKRAFNPKAFETGDERCPVKLFNEFVSHRSQQSCAEESPLFLQVRFNIDYKTEKIWYYEKPLGKNSIGNFMKSARTILNHPSRGKISNHSARKTTITNLLENNINPLHVQQVSGHKKLESLNQYNKASLQQQKTMSSIFSGNKQHHAYPSKNASNEVIPLEIQQQLMQSWNPFNTAIFQGATMNNCVFNINVNAPKPRSVSSSPCIKRRRMIIDDDSDDE